MSTYCSPSPFSNLLRRRHQDWQHEQPGGPQSTRSTRSACDPEAAASVILLGESPAVRRLRAQVERIAPYFRRVLVRGEAGAGKRLVAQTLHAMSPASGPFVACRAALLAEALATDREGREAGRLLESARGGTLYLEEVGEVPYGMQSRLLRLLSEQKSERRAGGKPQAAAWGSAQSARGVRIIGSTTRDLRAMASVGKFRQDLYAELSVVELVAAPLRQRAEDLPGLAAWILEHLSQKTGGTTGVLSGAALDELSGRFWKGNLRELETAMAHAAALADGPMLEVWHLPPEPETANQGLPQPAAKGSTERLQDVIHQHVVEVLTRCGGNKLRAAEALGISRSTLYRMLDAGPGGDVLQRDAGL